jgi:hypothetical protein
LGAVQVARRKVLVEVQNQLDWVVTHPSVAV